MTKFEKYREWIIGTALLLGAAVSAFFFRNKYGYGTAQVLTVIGATLLWIGSSYYLASRFRKPWDLWIFRFCMLVFVGLAFWGMMFFDSGGFGVNKYPPLGATLYAMVLYVLVFYVANGFESGDQRRKRLDRETGRFRRRTEPEPGTTSSSVNGETPN